MHARKLAFAAVLAAAVPFAGQAHDAVVHLPFQAVVQQAIQSGKLDGSVKFYLAGHTPAGKVSVIEDNAITNKKTNGFGKSHERSCNWALTSALMTLQKAAKNVGANAVIDVVSYYKRHTFTDGTHYECHAGFLMSGVTLKAKLAKVH